MTALAEVEAVVSTCDLVLARAWPRSREHLLLDLRTADGRLVAGQWFADEGAARDVADRTGGPARAHGSVVLQPDGADARLRPLTAVTAEPGAVLVAHRPERRGVVRRGDGRFSKVVRASRLDAVVAAARTASSYGLAVPQVSEVDAAAGVLTTTALPGRTLHDLLRDHPGRAVQAGHATGRALADLHAQPVAADAARHDGAAEQAVLDRWEQLAQAHGLLRPVRPGPCLATSAGPVVVLHRDLHDKQLMVAEDGSVGMLDFDLTAAGEAALDLANLLVHLELRVEQGWCSAATGAAVRAAVLEGYRPAAHVLQALPGYDRVSRRRLAAVYAFRPQHAEAARRLAAA